MRGVSRALEKLNTDKIYIFGTTRIALGKRCYAASETGSIQSKA